MQLVALRAVMTEAMMLPMIWRMVFHVSFFMLIQCLRVNTSVISVSMRQSEREEERRVPSVRGYPSLASRGLIARARSGCVIGSRSAARAAFYLLTRTYYHKYHLYTIRGIVSRWAPSSENDTEAYIANVARLTGIGPDEPLGIPSEQPSRWMLVGVAMAIQENGLVKREQSDACISSAEREDRRATLNGTESLDYFAMLRGWEMCRQDIQSR